MECRNPIDFGKRGERGGCAMGCMGSGNWYRWQGKKSTVEESLVVAMRDLHGRLFQGAAGTFTWTWGSDSKSSVGYAVTWNHDAPTVILGDVLRLEEEIVRRGKALLAQVRQTR